MLASLQLSLARALAGFLALFTLLNVIGSLRSPGFDANIWWIDVGYLPPHWGSLALVLAALALAAFAVGFPDHPKMRPLIATAAAVLTAAATWNTLVFYWLWFIGRIHPGAPVPLSLILTTTLAFIVRHSLRPWKFTARGQRIAFAVAFAACFILFPLAQMYCFGATDYRRKADAIVVFGARAYADGTLSQALDDRARTAIQLYKDGLAPVLIFSGGPGDGPTSEPQAMRKLALSLGVPEAAILLDEDGLNTEKSVINTLALAHEKHLTRLLAVSHFYHLPRIKMTYARGIAADKLAIEIHTVPAKESAPLTQMPRYILREIVALWAYYLRPLVS